MKEGEFPKEVTQDNFENLVKRAETIRKKSLQKRYLVLFIVPPSFMSIPFALAPINIMLWLARNGFLNFLLSFPLEFQLTFFFIFLLALTEAFLFSMMFLWASLVRWLNVTYLAFPRAKDAVFAECMIIANHLWRNNRIDAKKEARFLVSALRRYCRENKPTKRTLSPELKFVVKGRNSLRRVVMFSNRNRNLARFFARLGLTFVHDDYPGIFYRLKILIHRMDFYGLPSEGVQKIIAWIEHYPNSITILVTIVLFIISLIVTLLGYPR